MRSFKTLNWVKIKYYKGIRSVLPPKNGVYCIVYRNKAMYIGSTTNLKKRINGSHHAVISLIVLNKTPFSIFYYTTKMYGLYEATLTCETLPPLNINIGLRKQFHYVNSKSKLVSNIQKNKRNRR